MTSTKALLVLLITCFFNLLFAQDTPNALSGDTVLVNMAALDQPFMYNRLGAAQPTGMIFALEEDIVTIKPNSQKSPGNVRLKDGKRPRPIVLRANEGDILVINFTNYLRPYRPNGEVEFYPGHETSQETVNSIYPATRQAGVHILGMQLVEDIKDDGSYVGSNPTSLVQPGGSTTYHLFAGAEGAYLLISMADVVGDGTIRAGQISNGLFGSINVQPPNAEWYRSQVSEEDLYEATTHYLLPSEDQISPPTTIPKKDIDRLHPQAFPVIDYNATFSDGTPILKMYKQVGPHTRELVYTDLTALITGPGGGDFPLWEDNPAFYNVPASPDRRQPYREFSIHYHEAPYAVQSFPIFYDNLSDTIKNITQTVQGGVDQFAINYGTGGIGAEIYANRIKVGPMQDCVDCAYEEFFLSAWAVGDPAQVVDIPANAVEAAQKKKTQNLTPKQLEELTNKTLNDLMLEEAALLSGDFLSANVDQPSKVRATKVYYPDDPSNVYHSYMNDHVKFRISHAGAGITHVHHQHAHQWLHSPNNDKGHYLDSQTINPGSSYTLEMVFGGSGNLNKTVGDQIFHCHFYPHFAQGMWSMWRVHDVLETGTVMNEDGTVSAGARALPDGEILSGVPIPGLVPIPNLPMAPVPGIVMIDEGGQIVIPTDSTTTLSNAISPGYPFYIPGVAGRRAPHPPLDFAKGDVTTVGGKTLKNTSLNGGLPRSVIIDGKVPFENHTKYDWTKLFSNLHALELPEEGTFFEQVAMKAHATRVHNTLTPTGQKGNFLLNGLPPVAGAPYADPAVDENGIPVPQSKLRRYKAANIQVDAVLNKLGWHYPQQRPIVLWGDVAATVAGERPPEPFFMRANSGEFVEYWHSNLVPEYYELDDYQVRTPTDVIGQHIHLVKFDVTSSDGAANGWNYEDGTLSPEMVRKTIGHINNGGQLIQPTLTTPFSGSLLSVAESTAPSKEKLEVYKSMPIWGSPPAGDNWDGAQTTIQRWYADPLLDNKGNDRTLRTVFTHDHFSPSTHQQIGLYAALLIEPNQSVWLDNENINDTLGIATLGKTREVPTAFSIAKSTGVPTPTATGQIDDGGPTDWQAIIQTANAEDSYREFMFEFQDNQQAYTKDSRATPDIYPVYFSGKVQGTSFADSVNNSYRGWIDHQHVISPPPAQQGQFTTPELVSTGNRGTWSVNYRNEPLPPRLVDNLQADTTLTAESINAAYVYSSDVTRALTALNSQPTPGYIAKGANKFIFPVQPLAAEMQPGDPYTPLARAYAGDKVQIRSLVGAHVNPHYFNINGVKWLFEPSAENSGFRSTQMTSLSEHFEFNFQMPFTDGNEQGIADYLYRTNADIQGQLNGTWGIMRSYDTIQPALAMMPNNDIFETPEAQNSGCPADANRVHYNVTAVSIDQYQQMGENWGKLPYNRRYRNFDTKAIVYVRTEELHDFKFAPDYEIRPLVLRANSGDCIEVTLENDITTDFIANYQAVNYQDVQSGFIYNTSFTVGLHPELLSYDVSQNDGMNVGLNTPGQQTLDQGGGKVEYEWYAGQWNQKADGGYVPQPVEFGTVILGPPDPLMQHVAGLFGAIVVEPENSYWVPNKNKYTDHTSANVYASREAFDAGEAPLFREFVFMFQDDIDVPAEPEGDLQGDPVVSAVNYKSEPLASRIFIDPEGDNNFNQLDLDSILSNITTMSDPETPVFAAVAGVPMRLRLMHPGGVGDGVTFNLHGHVWQEEPYVEGSTKLGYNPKSQWFGFRDQLGALNAFDLLVSKAGGAFGVPGDYLYRDYRNQTFQNGMWGVLRVTDGLDAPIITNVHVNGSMMTVTGVNTVDPNTGKYAATVSLSGIKGSINVNNVNGTWTSAPVALSISNPITVTTSTGGSRTYSVEELQHLSKHPRTRVNMSPARRPGIKQVEPGANPTRRQVQGRF